MAAIARPVPRSDGRGKGLVLVALLVLALSGLAISLVFVWPHAKSTQTSFNLGSVDSYAVGSVTTVPKGKFHLVRLGDNEFLALSWREPGRGCTVPWRPTFAWPDPATGFVTTGWFRDPCTGSTFSRDGHRVYGPAPRDMDRYPVSIMNGHAIVDTSQYVCGFAPPASYCVAATLAS